MNNGPGGISLERYFRQSSSSSSSRGSCSVMFCLELALEHDDAIREYSTFALVIVKCDCLSNECSLEQCFVTLALSIPVSV